MDKDKIVGLTEQEATSLLEENGVAFRISGRVVNGKAERYMLTCDYISDRMNLDIVEGKVKNVSFG